MRKPVVLITGANGFVGRNLVPLLKSNNYIVRRALRAGACGDHDVLVGSIGPSTDWGDALANVDAVVHLAARVHHAHEENAAELYEAVNTQGTIELARAAARAKVSKFVFLSTILVNGTCTDRRRPFTSEDKVSPRGVYSRSKAAAEAALRELADESEMRVSVVRPPLVYGPNARGNFSHLVAAIRRRIPLPFGLTHNRRAFVSVQNLASFVLALIELHPAVPYQIYLVADDEQVSTATFARRIGKAMNRHVIMLPIPSTVLELALKATRPGLRDSLLGSMEIDTSAALSTGWAPPFSMEDGLRLALEQSG